MNKRNLYHTLIEPHSGDPNVRNQELVLNWLLVGSLCLAALAFANTLFSFVALHDSYILPRLTAIVCLFGLFGVLLGLSRRKQHQVLPAIVLISIFFASASWIVYQWGTLAPTGILLFSLVIVTAGILLNARFALYAALLITLALSLMEYAKAHHYIHPSLAWERRPSSFSDVGGFAAIYAILALVSWLFNRQMEMALRRAKRSERALKRQRDSLEVEVEQRTRQLQAAQLEQIQEVYRFAELGHLSTVLFHDLANHLMSVSIDIEGLQKGKRSVMLARIQENITYVNEVVRRVRRQISGQTSTGRFKVADEIDEVIKMLAYQSNQARVAITLQTAPASRQATYRGDLTRFRQIIINLLSNAIEAYDTTGRPASARQSVIVTVAKLPDSLSITVTDHGKTIKPSVQARIFEPFYSTKDKGMGIGLFIVKKVTEEDFGGTISLTSNKRAGTAFVVTLPLRGGHGHRPNGAAS